MSDYRGEGEGREDMKSGHAGVRKLESATWLQPRSADKTFTPLLVIAAMPNINCGVNRCVGGDIGQEICVKKKEEGRKELFWVWSTLKGAA